MKRKLLLLIIAFYSCCVMSQTYDVAVGETQYLPVPSVSVGYVAQATWACSNPAIKFESKDEIGATIKIIKSFSGTATIELVYVQTYIGTYSKKTEFVTHYKTFSIRCKTGSSGGAPTAITLPSSLTISEGSSKIVVPELTPANATTTFSWNISSSSTTGVITVVANNDGTFTVYGGKIGTSRLNIYTSNDLSASCMIKVVDPNAPISISLPEKQTILAGNSINLTPVIEPASASTTLTWSVNDKTIASVRSGKVTAKKCGSTTVQVKTTNGLTAQCKIKIINQVSDTIFQRAFGFGTNLINRSINLKKNDNEK